MPAAAFDQAGRSDPTLPIFFAVLLLATLACQAWQGALPQFESLHHARLMLYPAVLAYGALALPYPLVLALAFCTGLFWDLLNLQPVAAAAATAAAAAARGVAGGGVEISAGTNVFLYGALCTVMHGLRPLFLRGRWEVHAFLAALFTFTVLAAEFLLMNLRRGGFEFPTWLWWRLGAPAVFSAMVAPFVFALFHVLATILGVSVRQERVSPNAPAALGRW